jgi:hypothetical protein
VGKRIQGERTSLNYKTVAGLFRIVDEAGQGVVVPYGGAQALLDEIVRRRHLTFDDRRKLQRFTVNLYPQWIKRLGPDLRPLIGAEEGLIRYAGEYDPALGIRLGELPPEVFGFFDKA